MKNSVYLLVVFVALLGLRPSKSSGDQPILFGRDVRPILAKHCFACHGPDPEARQADLRLSTEDGATTDLGGYHAINPGNADKSELMQRVTSDDADLRMPPADSKPPQARTKLLFFVGGFSPAASINSTGLLSRQETCRTGRHVPGAGEIDRFLFKA